MTEIERKVLERAGRDVGILASAASNPTAAGKLVVEQVDGFSPPDGAERVLFDERKSVLIEAMDDEVRETNRVANDWIRTHFEHLWEPGESNPNRPNFRFGE